MKTVKREILYSDLARYYDLIYSWKDYEKESNRIKELISKYKQSTGNELLDVACGTGLHLKYLKDSFVCTGIDLNGRMLDIARKTVKGVAFKEADMTRLNLNKKFDVITCLFGSIGYLKTDSNLKKTIHNLVNHLKVGGIIILESWVNRANYKPGYLHMTTYDGEDVKIARLSVSKINRNRAIVEFHYLIAERNKDVEYFVDRHELGIFETEKVVESMRRAGLDVKLLPNRLSKGREIYLGIRK